MEIKAYIDVLDDNHLWYNHKQYISLQRYTEAQTNNLNEIEILEKEIDKLREENNAYKVIFENNKEKYEVEYYE